LDRRRAFAEGEAQNEDPRSEAKAPKQATLKGLSMQVNAARRRRSRPQ